MKQMATKEDLRLSWKKNGKMIRPANHSMHTRLTGLFLNHEDIFNYVSTCIMCTMMNAVSNLHGGYHIMRYAVPDSMVDRIGTQMINIQRKGDDITIYL